MCKTRVKAHRANEMSGSESSETEFLYTVTEKPGTEEVVNAVMDREIYANMLIDNKPVKFHIDCGATVNVLPSKYVNIANIKPTKRVLQMWNKTELKPKGVCRVKMRNPNNNRKYSVEFIIVKDELTPLLGAKVIQQMGLIKMQDKNFDKVSVATTTTNHKNGNQARTGSNAMTGRKKVESAKEIIEQYKDVFEGELGSLDGEQTLTADPTRPKQVINMV